MDEKILANRYIDWLLCWVPRKRKPYSVVDPKVRDLVAALNSAAFHTYASCQGHPGGAYVSFKTTTKKASALARLLLEDSVNPKPNLHWCWYVDGGFNGKQELIFSIRSGNKHHWLSNFVLGRMDTDFATIIELLDQIGDDMDGINPARVPKTAN